MTKFSDDPLFSPSRRSMMLLAGAGAVAATASLSARADAPATTTSAIAPAYGPYDPNELAIMSSNENPFGPSAKAVEAMKSELVHMNRYTYPTVMKFAEMVAQREGVAPEQVLVTNGSTPILAAFADWVNVRGGKIITSAITYEGVPRVAEQAGTEVVYMPLTQDMGYDMEAIAARVGPDTGAVYICNPNNPTGKTIPPAVLKAFIEEVSAKVPVFIDEAYLDMSDDYPAGVMSSYVAAGKNVVVARTFSKLYAMAGQRLGYGIMPAEMAMDMRKTGRLSNVNYLGLVAGMASLEDTAYFEEMRAKTIRGRAKLIAMAADLGRPIAPDPQGSFIYMDVGMPAKDFAAKMLDRGVKVVGERWTEMPNWSRICVGLDHEIEKCHAAAKEVLTAI